MKTYFFQKKIVILNIFWSDLEKFIGIQPNYIRD